MKFFSDYLKVNHFYYVNSICQQVLDVMSTYFIIIVSFSECFSF